MNTPYPLARRFAYNTWANGESYRSVERQDGQVPGRAVELIGHILAVERHWLGRLGVAPASGGPVLPIWPALPLADYRPILVDLAAAWPGLVASFVRDGLDRPVLYRNTRGEEFASSRGDILEHLLLHAAYHRGQVATLLGLAGLTSANTDLIHWTRTVEPARG